MRRGPSDVEVPADKWCPSGTSGQDSGSGRVDWLERERREILPADVVIEWERHGGYFGSKGFAVERAGKIVQESGAAR